MKTVYATKFGASLESNHWKENDEVFCSENLANYFVEKGICKETLEEQEKEQIIEKQLKKIKK